MRTGRSGFTLIEVMFVVVIGAIVLGIGTREYSKLADQRAVGNARDAMIQTAFRARSEAMRSGRLVFMRVKPNDGLVEVATASDSVMHTLNVSNYRVTIGGSALAVCYAARGYALPGCTSVTTTQDVSFVRGTDTASAVVMSMGHVRRKQ